MTIGKLRDAFLSHKRVRKRRCSGRRLPQWQATQMAKKSSVPWALAWVRLVERGPAARFTKLKFFQISYFFDV
jgi:hypothetical protein